MQHTGDTQFLCCAQQNLLTEPWGWDRGRRGQGSCSESRARSGSSGGHDSSEDSSAYSGSDSPSPRQSRQPAAAHARQQQQQQQQARAGSRDQQQQHPWPRPAPDQAAGKARQLASGPGRPSGGSGDIAAAKPDPGTAKREPNQQPSKHRLLGSSGRPVLQSPGSKSAGLNQPGSNGAGPHGQPQQRHAGEQARQQQHGKEQGRKQGRVQDGKAGGTPGAGGSSGLLENGKGKHAAAGQPRLQAGMQPGGGSRPAPKKGHTKPKDALAVAKPVTCMLTPSGLL